jgi:hypothetical protein
MRFGKALPALCVLIAVGALIVMTGTGAAAPTPSAASVAPASSNLDAYLRALGVNRASLVTQRGARNYAGPNCPGKGWNCTTATRVLQIATASGQNKVDCTPGSIVSTSPTQSCVIVQTGTNNKAQCHQRSDSSAAVQHCSITQTGDKNDADIHQTVHADDNDSMQTATQTAKVEQNGGSNKSHVKQEVKQKAKDGASQMQDAHQVAEVDQIASGSGDNNSNVDQDIEQNAHGAAATQRQNTGSGPAACGFAPGAPSNPNQCANVSQTSDEGKNDSRLKQSIREDAKTKASAANQQQGSPDGGILGQVHQSTVTGTSTSRADQDKRQKLSAPDNATQSQYDPVSCCGFSSQDGGENNKEDIKQSSTQDANADAFQNSLLTGSSRSPNGECTIDQKAKNNADNGDNDASAEPCPALLLVTSCFAAGEGGEDFTAAQEESAGDCTEEEVDPCQAEEFCPDDEEPCSECECYTCEIFAVTSAQSGANVRTLGRQNR